MKLTSWYASTPSSLTDATGHGGFPDSKTGGEGCLVRGPSQFLAAPCLGCPLTSAPAPACKWGTCGSPNSPTDLPWAWPPPHAQLQSNVSCIYSCKRHHETL